MMFSDGEADGWLRGLRAKAGSGDDELGEGARSGMHGVGGPRAGDVLHARGRAGRARRDTPARPSREGAGCENRGMDSSPVTTIDLDLHPDERFVPLRDALNVHGFGINQLTLQPGQDKLEIDYTGLSFIKSEQLRFRYRLESLDENWTEVLGAN